MNKKREKGKEGTIQVVTITKVSITKEMSICKVEEQEIQPIPIEKRYYD